MFKKTTSKDEEPKAPPKVEDHAYEDSWYRALKAQSERVVPAESTAADVEDDEVVEGTED